MWIWLILTGLQLIAQGQQGPYFDFSKAGSGFFGPGREVSDPAGLTSVRIGVLGPGKDAEGLQMRTGVRMALDEMNRRGGYKGIPYEMVFRPDDGPWGMAAKQVVDFAYEDKVWTIIGGLDGQRTHVAELVVSKAWVPVVTPTAAHFAASLRVCPWIACVRLLSLKDLLYEDRIPLYAKNLGRQFNRPHLFIVQIVDVGHHGV